MKLTELKQKTSKFPILSKKIIASFEQNPVNLAGNIKYWLKTGDLIALKNGWYVIKERYASEPQKDHFRELAATQIIQPSYLSLEYVLDKYQLLTESVFAVTLITSKTTREVKTDLGFFRYYSISPDLFDGYEIKYFYGAPIFEATKSKAIFDYLYLRFLKTSIINEQAVEELRINWIAVKKSEWNVVVKYAGRARSRRVRQVVELIGNKYFNS